MPEVLYHCSCLAPSAAPPAFGRPSSSYSFHRLDHLYFCEECDAIRCGRCLAVEITCYYCPNCLFEVPGASVRQEKNRCARNCFVCPSCTNTLSVVASDPTSGAALTSTGASIGEPPYYLSCGFCRWDSKEVGITFEKPTGLTLQLQKFEDLAPDVLEVDHLRDFYEPFVRSHSTSTLSGVAPSSTSSAAIVASAALNSSLLRDIPGLANSRYASGLFGIGGRGARGAGALEPKEDLARYEALSPAASGEGRGEGRVGKVGRREERRIETIKYLKDADEATSLEQRWNSPWDQPVRASDLKPQRVPLQAKQSKRCPVCRHIIIKPDQKATTFKFKMRLLAITLLPNIDIVPSTSPLAMYSSALTSGAGSRLSQLNARRRINPVPAGASQLSSSSPSGASVGPPEEDVLVAGKSYTYELTFTNPTYDPIDVRLNIARPVQLNPRSPTSKSPTIEAGSGSGAAQATNSSHSSTTARLPWTVSIPASSFSVSAYNDALELEEDEEGLFEGIGVSRKTDEEDDVGSDEEEGSDDDVFDGDRRRSSRYGTGGRRKGRKEYGLLGRKGNKTTVTLELVVSKEAEGDIEFGLNVFYSWREQPEEPSSPRRQSKSPSTPAPEADDPEAELRTFSFWSLVKLGRIVPREEPSSSSHRHSMAGAGGPGSVTDERKIRKRTSMAF